LSTKNYSVESLRQQLTCGEADCQCQKEYGNRAFRLHCPAHGDPNPSLMISSNGAASNVHCAQACTPEQLIAALAARGLYPPENGHKTGFILSNLPIPAKKYETKITIIPSVDIQPYEHDAAPGALEPFIPPQPAVVLFSGETSAGKTVANYNIAYSLSEGVEFAGFMPSHAVRVLYLDLESPESVHRGLVDAVGRSKNLAFVRVLPNFLSSKDGQDQFRQACIAFKADVVFIDPLPVAWPVRDENDNAEADKQISAVKRLAVELNLVIVALWNMGGGNPKEKFKARGATARLDRVDVAINYTEITDKTRQVKIVKSRYGTLGNVYALQFKGDLGFDSADLTQLTGGPTEISEIKNRLRALMRDGEKKRKDLVERFPGKEALVDKALGEMLKAGEIDRPKRGTYRLIVSNFLTGIGEYESMKGAEAAPNAHQANDDASEDLEVANHLTKELQKEIIRLADLNDRRSRFAPDAPDEAVFRGDVDDWVAREHHFRDQFDDDRDGPCIFGIGGSCPQYAPVKCSKCSNKRTDQ